MNEPFVLANNFFACLVVGLGIFGTMVAGGRYMLLRFLGYSTENDAAQDPESWILGFVFAFALLLLLRKASLFGIPSSDKELSLSTLLVGYWPDFSGAKAAIDQINVHPTDGCREWETNIRKLAAAQPERIVPPKHVVDNEVIYSLCDAFLNECRRAMAS